MMKEFEKLKAGDKVLLSYSVCIDWTSFTSYKEATVEKITPSGLIVVDGMKFYSENGMERSSGKRMHIKMIDDEDALSTISDIKKKEIVYKVRMKAGSRDFSPTYDQALKIAAVMGW